MDSRKCNTLCKTSLKTKLKERLVITNSNIKNATNLNFFPDPVLNIWMMNKAMNNNTQRG